MGVKGNDESRGITVDRVSHEVIEAKLLASLSDKNKVALVLTHNDLKRLIRAVHLRIMNPTPDVNDQELLNLDGLLSGMVELRRQAFGNGAA